MPPALTAIEREMAKSYVLVHSRLVNRDVRAENFGDALTEARGIVHALERLAEATPRAARPAPVRGRGELRASQGLSGRRAADVSGDDWQ